MDTSRRSKLAPIAKLVPGVILHQEELCYIDSSN